MPDTEIRYRPSFATLFVTLKPGESIIAESDAMASMSASTDMKTRFNGGFFNGLLRKFFGGESLFVNEFLVKDGDQSADVVITQPTPGDVMQLDLSGNTYFIQPGGFIACGAGVKLGLGWAGFRSWFAGEGLFRLKVSGHGPVWLGAYGGISTKEVNGDYVVDSSHLVAYEPGVKLKIGLSGGIFSSFFGGEGFVSRMEGQGEILIQSRSMDGLASWTNAHIY